MEHGKMVLWQLKKILHCHFPDLRQRLSSLSDPRKGIAYSIEELVMGGVVLFLSGCKSRNEFNHKVKDVNFAQNYYRIFGLHLPGMDAVNDLFKELDTHELEDIRCLLLKVLIEKRVLHKFRFFGNCFCVAVDATGIYNWGDSPPASIFKYALKRESSSGKVTYFSQILEAVIICRGGLVVPLLSEWIANDGVEYDRQDCELKAFKRLSVRLKKYFPRLNLCILADGLYSNVAMMDICEQYGWKFITVFKDGNLPSVWQEVESLLPLQAEARKIEQRLADSTHWITRHYKWVNQMEYQKHSIDWLECLQENQHRQTGDKSDNRFVFITNLQVSPKNIFSILDAGRSRWGIEDHFNTQKNRDGALHHKFNRNNFKALQNWHHVRQLACMIREFVKYCPELQQIKKENPKMTWKELWKSLNSLLTMCLEEIAEIIHQFEHWAKVPRQVRLE